VLRRRAACPVPGTMVGKTTGKEKTASNEYKKQEEDYEHEKQENGIAAGGYLIGRHRECGKSWSHEFAEDLNLTDVQIASSTHSLFRTDTASCSPRRRLATPLPYSKISLETEPL
jgi:hypothetical protein